MSASHNDDPEILAAAYIHLAARIDALRALVLVLAKNAGCPLSQVRAALATIEETMRHKYRERLEGHHPALAALLQSLEASPEIDLDLLEQLRFGDEPPPNVDPKS